MGCNRYGNTSVPQGGAVAQPTNWPAFAEASAGWTGCTAGFFVKRGEDIGGMGDRGDTENERVRKQLKRMRTKRVLGTGRAWKCRRADILGWVVPPVFSYVGGTMKLL